MVCIIVLRKHCTSFIHHGTQQKGSLLHVLLANPEAMCSCVMLCPAPPQARSCFADVLCEHLAASLCAKRCSWRQIVMNAAGSLLGGDVDIAAE